MKHKDNVIHNVIRHCANSDYIEEGKVQEFENMLILNGIIKRDLPSSVILYTLRKLEVNGIMCIHNIKYRKSIKINKNKIIVKYIIFEGVQ